MSHLSEHSKTVLDLVSVTTVLATLAAWAPPLAAVVSIVWGLIRIWETQTVQRIVNRVRGCNCPTPGNF